MFVVTVILFWLFIGFFVALFLIVLSTILLLIWRVRKAKGKNPKKRWLILPLIVLILPLIVLILPLIVLILSLLFELIPLGIISLNWQKNRAEMKEKVTLKSKKIVYWNQNNYHTFVLDGVKYAVISADDEPFNFNQDGFSRGDVIANITVSDDSFSYKLVNGVSERENNMQMILPLKTKSQFLFYGVADSLTVEIRSPYVLAQELPKIQAYYRNLENYDKENVICDALVFGNHNDYQTIDKALKLNLEVFKTLADLSQSEENLITVAVPQDYTDIEAQKKKGDFASGFEQWAINVFSQDKVATQSIRLAKIDQQIYRVKSLGTNMEGVEGSVLEGYKIDPALNAYLLSTVFHGRFINFLLRQSISSHSPSIAIDSA
ncbi:hypothetical protein RyT2_17860 [Pseudolactococcus yaeyamensis]